MHGAPPGAVLDLMAATRAGGGDDRILASLTDGREENEFADLLGNGKVLALVAEGTGHAAATGGNHGHAVARGQLQHFDRRSQR